MAAPHGTPLAQRDAPRVDTAALLASVSGALSLCTAALAAQLLAALVGSLRLVLAFAPIVLALAAVALGALALYRVRRDGQSFRSNALAVAGIGMGAVVLLAFY
jgi:hypothetical protein